MANETLFLRSNVQVEPLCLRWYAWPHLIAPSTACRNITERHFQIMSSYIAAPELHASAVKNPSMRGGPFIDYASRRVEEIKALLESTRALAADFIEMSKAIVEIDALLLAQARGYSLQCLYNQIPTPLRGYIELTYDLHSNPSFRFIEPLLYQRYYDASHQSLMLSLISADDRPFVLSTPRLDSADTFHLRIPFHDESVDSLFRTKQEPKPWSKISNSFDVSDKQLHTFRSLFTDKEPRKYQRYHGSGVRWRYFGHACILIETKDITLLFDPVLSYTYENTISRYTYDDLPDQIDYVVITHDHQDHILFETLLQIRRRTNAIVVPRNRRGSLQDPSLKLILEKTGFRNVLELDELGSIDFTGGSITGLPFLGEHADLDIYSKLGYLVRFGRVSMLVLADSCNIDPSMYENLHALFGDVNVLFLGMECDGAPLSWLYGPLLTTPLERSVDTSRRLAGCNYEQAYDIVSQFSPKEVYVYAMGQEPWLNYIMSIKYTEESRPIVESNRLITKCQSQGIRAERLFGEKEILVEEL